MQSEGPFRMFRLRWLTALTVLLAFAGVTASAQTNGGSPATIRFSLEGRIEGPAGLFYLPLDKGFYAAEKLDVRIEPPRPMSRSRGSPAARPTWRLPTSMR
jgi:hypothetical protein